MTRLFAADLQLKALKRCVPMLASEGLVYVESPQEISDEASDFPVSQCDPPSQSRHQPYAFSSIREPVMITATYPGTFDPLTNGHLDLIRRACWIFSEAHCCSGGKQKKTYALYFGRARSDGQRSRQRIPERLK